jgi:hydrocephalus-inducing protein
VIDFGQTRFSEVVYKDFFIENTGKVAFGYKITLEKLIRKGLIDVSPQVGRIQGGEK